MFEIGHDILNHKLKDVRIKRDNSHRLLFLFNLFLFLFGLCVARTLYLGAVGNNAPRYVNNQGVVSRADIVDRGGKDVLA